MCSSRLRLLLLLFVFSCTSYTLTYGAHVVVADDNSAKRLKVAVIGAGAAGISASRHLTSFPDDFDVTVFEKTASVGGTWVYTDKTGLDEHGQPIHSSMYKNLRTNLPIQIMNFPDWPEIKGQNRSCVPHPVILEYLNNYTDHYNLRPLIKFNTKVMSVKLDEPQYEGSPDQWRIKTKDLETTRVTEQIFDAVVICNGHYFNPYVPKIPGLENFEGDVMHSHSYRVPEVFKGKRVVLLGAASSGLDIALEVAKSAAATYLSHNQAEKIARRSKNMGFTEVRGIDRFEDGKFILKDNTSLEVDAVIFCTGYNFVYPFLDKSTGITVDENYISPLYKHMINADHPSMAFVGVPTGVVPFPLFHVQSQYIASVLNGKAELPSQKEMQEDAKLKTTKKRHAHQVTNQWAYSDELAKAGQFAPLPYYYRVGSQAWNILKKEYPKDFKKFNLIVGADKISVKIVGPIRL